MAIVTGATKGFGLGIGKLTAGRGAKVAAWGRDTAGLAEGAKGYKPVRVAAAQHRVECAG